LIERCPAVQPEEVAALVQPILEHLRTILGKKQNVDFMIAWLAQLIQDPANPTQVCPILQGEQGTGKDILFSWFIEAILGRPAGYQTAKPHEDIFGKHSLAQKNCALALFDEISAASTGPIMDLLKNFITGGKHNLDPKHGKQYEVANFTNVMCTTNYANPIVIASIERRFVVFQCRETLLNNVPYFTKLAEHLEQPKVPMAFYQYLRDSVDVVPFKPFHAHRPKTDAYIAMQQSSIELPYVFLSQQVRIAAQTKLKTATVASQAFFDLFLKWGVAANHNMHKWNAGVFAKDMRRLETRLTEIHSSEAQQKIFRIHFDPTTGCMYEISWPRLQKFLKAKSLYHTH